MKKIYFIFFLIVCGILTMSAQPKLPEKNIVFYPEVLLSSSVLTESQALALAQSDDYGQKKSPRDKRFWIVYSDRDDNTTYTEPGGKVPFSSLSLNDCVRIAQIKNGYAMVYDEPQADIAYPMISQYAECKGWIPMKNLLLWHSCPANSALIYNKALLCVNLDQKSNSNLGHLYRNPSNKGQFELLETDMRFYFVMKREGNLALLASTHTMDGRSDKMLKGWVDEQSYVAWNQRSCIEPTWNIKDVEYFADEKVQVNIFKEPSQTQCVTKIDFRRKETTKYDKYLYRMGPDNLRFPLLDDGTQSLYSCSTFGTAGNGAVVLNGDSDESSPLGVSEKVLNELSHINIGIVIDGTSSMEAFYPAVKEAIKEGRKFFSKKYNVKVGVIIYRDYGDGEFVTEEFRLSNPDNPKLEEFLNTGGKYGIKSARSDKTYEEAMYLGINTALDRLGFKDGQSNLLLVVGDCGNARNDKKITSESLISKLVQKNVHIMGFQVRRSQHDAFELFNGQMLDLMRKSLEKKYANLNNDIKVRIKETKDGYTLVNDVESKLYVGTHNFPEYGKEVQITKLTPLMVDATKYCSGTVQYEIDLLTSFNSGAFKPNPNNVNSEVDIDEEWLKQTLGENYEKIKESNSLLAFKGYTNKTHQSGRSYFKPVVFISSDELNSLIERLAPVNDAAVVQANDREPYIRAMKALVQVMVPDISDEEMSKMGYKEVMAMASGLNEAAGALKGYTIAEIASNRAVSHTEYASLVSDFRRKYEMLKRLKAQPYKYTKTFNGLKYYWLPVEDLP